MHENVPERSHTRNALMWRGRSIAEMGPICVGVATTKCNALREVGEMNLVERKGLVARAVGTGSLLSLGNWIHYRRQPPVFTANIESRHIVQGASQ